MATRTVTATALRQNLYRILDEVIESGVPVEIERRGRRLRIVAAEAERKVDRLQRRAAINGDPEALVHVDWSDTWSGETR